MTKFSLEDRPTWDMIHEAASEALDDSGMSMKDIDAVVVSTEDSLINPERQRNYPSVVSSLLKKKMPIIRVPAVCGGGGVSLWTAQRLDFNNILILAAERLAMSRTDLIVNEIMNAAERVWEQQEGLNFPAENALVAQEHMLKYGTTTDDLALISLKNHENAYLNPKTPFYKKKVTLEQIKKSPIVASPLRLFDCTMNVNGAAACIISKDKTDIKIAGSGMATDYLAPFEREDMATWRATIKASEKAYKQADISPEDIDLAEVHDAFTIVELIAYEDLGFCKKGDGANLIRNGTVKLDGKLPINTSGGLKARGHPISATGLGQIYELVKQLRKQACDRQVSKANIALAQNIGGAGGSIAVHALRKIGG